MVALFNFIPFVFIVLMGLAGWRLTKSTGKRIGIAVLTVVCLLVYAQVQPSYGPKGIVSRTELPAFEDRKIEANDLLLKPKGGEFYDEQRAKAYEQIELKAQKLIQKEEK